MYRNWKRSAALGLTVLLGCMMPMSTMLAAEDGAEIGTDSFSDEENVSNDESNAGEGNISNDENDSDAGNVSNDENNADEENLSSDESDSSDVNIPGNAGDVPDDEGDKAQIDAENMAAAVDMNGSENADTSETVEALEIVNASESVTAPEIVITRDGENRTCSLGGEIAFEYVNYFGALFEVSVSQNEQDISLFYYLDRVTDTEAEAKKEEQMDSLRWTEETTFPISIEPLRDGGYVVYVKVKAGEKIYYARSGGVVVDTHRPEIIGVEEGKSYPEGTTFQVEDANLESVTVNEQSVMPEDGSYKVAANGSSCVIRAKDKAGNETTCSINVSVNETPETDNVISKSGDYALKAGKKYHLTEGKWQVAGDGSVYQGGIDFYVKVDGTYTFSK